MEDKGCYYLVNVKQGGNQWKIMREKRITMSNIGKVVGHAPYFTGTKEYLADLLMGRKKETFTEEAKARMNKGNKYEPIVRDYLEKSLGVQIGETGFAIWKQDPRFGASLDGVIDQDTGIEIKCPARMYRPIREYMERKESNDSSFDERDVSHIWRSQYDQIIGNGVITGRKNMIFCVYAIDEKKIFTQNIEVDYNYWNNFLYPKSVEFYEKYME